MKKLLALLMAMAMLLSLLVGCGGDDEKKDDDNGGGTNIGEDAGSDDRDLTEDDLVGEWDMVVDFNKMLQVASGIPGIGSVAGESGTDITAMLEAFEGIDLGDMRLGVTFTADGEMKLDTDDLIDATIGMLDRYIEWLGEGDNLYDFVAKSTGMSKAEVKAELEGMGMTAEAYISMMQGQFDTMKESFREAVDEIESEMETTYYSLEGNKLCTWSDEEAKSYFVIEYDGDINVTAVINDGETIELDKGTLTFEK